jgi:hypothetical protein
VVRVFGVDIVSSTDQPDDAEARSDVSLLDNTIPNSIRGKLSYLKATWASISRP